MPSTGASVTARSRCRIAAYRPVLTRRRPPRAGGAGGGGPVPSGRRGFAVSTPRSNRRRSGVPERAVAWCTITSGCTRATASPTAVPSRPSSTSGVAPIASTSPALLGDRVVATTSWPRSTNLGTSALPTAPVAPLTSTRMAQPPSPRLPQFAAQDDRAGRSVTRHLPATSVVGRAGSTHQPAHAKASKARAWQSSTLLAFGLHRRPSLHPRVARLARRLGRQRAPVVLDAGGPQVLAVRSRLNRSLSLGAGDRG